MCCCCGGGIFAIYATLRLTCHCRTTVEVDYDVLALVLSTRRACRPPPTHPARSSFRRGLAGRIGFCVGFPTQHAEKIPAKKQAKLLFSFQRSLPPEDRAQHQRVIHRCIDGKHRRNVEPRSWLLCRTPRERADALWVGEDAALAPTRGALRTYGEG
jgi:hypothetical protein